MPAYAYILIAALVVGRVAREVSWMLERRAQRAASADLVALIALVDRLCQRVQAPELAAAAHAREELGEPEKMYASLDDDDEVRASVAAWTPPEEAVR